MDIERLLENLRPCPKCGGKIRLYSTLQPGKNYNCLAKCMSCKEEYPMPKAWLKTYGASKIYPQSIKKAIRIWNEGNDDA